MLSTSDRAALGPRDASPCWGKLAPWLVAVLLASGSLQTGTGLHGAEPASQQETPTATVAPQRDPVFLIDQAVEQLWKESKLQPSLSEDDGIWARRVYLDIIGRPPTVLELQTFLASRERNRRLQLVDTLLGPRYQEEFAETWADIYTNILIGRAPENNDAVNRRGLWEFLYQAFLENRPYDKLTKELLTATGTNLPGDENHNGAVNYLAGKVRDGAIQATDSTSRVFLGTQVQCTQCHDHPFGKAKQRQFWELNAFFRQTRALRREVSRDVRYVELVDEDFIDETGDAEAAAVFYDLRNNKRKAAFPVFIDEEVISPDKRPLASGRVDVANRRQALAEQVVASPMFAEAAVNRMWAHFLGQGFTKPIDDMGPHNPRHLPELLTGLAEDFRYSGHDLKRLIRSIAVSKPYGLTSRATPKNEKDDLTLGNAPLFTRFYARQLSPEQLYNALDVAATGLTHEQLQAESKWLTGRGQKGPKNQSVSRGAAADPAETSMEEPSANSPKGTKAGKNKRNATTGAGIADLQPNKPADEMAEDSGAEMPEEMAAEPSSQNPAAWQDKSDKRKAKKEMASKKGADAPAMPTAWGAVEGKMSNLAWDRAQARNNWVRQFARSLGNDNGSESTNFNGTIPQILSMMNGERTNRAISLDPGSFLQRLSQDNSISNEQKIDLLFLSAVARPADKVERQAADRILWGRKGEVAMALQDLYWALLNSNEFILNH